MTTRFRFGSLLLAAFLSSATGISQTAQISRDVSSSQPSQGPMMKVRLGRWGFLLVPEGYRTYLTEDLLDAWVGCIVSPGDDVRIHWSAGMFVSPFQETEDKFVWTKNEKLSKFELRYGLKRTAQGEMIVAAVPGLNLYMPVKKEKDINSFLAIARSYKIEACSDCKRPLREPQEDEFWRLWFLNSSR